MARSVNTSLHDSCRVFGGVVAVAHLLLTMYFLYVAWMIVVEGETPIVVLVAAICAMLVAVSGVLILRRIEAGDFVFILFAILLAMAHAMSVVEAFAHAWNGGEFSAGHSVRMCYLLAMYIGLNLAAAIVLFMNAIARYRLRASTDPNTTDAMCPRNSA